jgi:hypothetical protein
MIHSQCRRPGRLQAAKVALLLGGFFLLAVGCSGGKKDGDSDKDKDRDKGDKPQAATGSLKLVPANAPGFATVALAGWWNGPHGKVILQKLASVNPDGQLEKVLGVPPSQAERVTAVTLPTGGLYTIVSTTGAYDRNKVQGLLAPGARERKVGNHSLYASRTGSAVLFVDDRTFILGRERDLASAPTTPEQAGSKGPLQAALGLGDKHLVVVGVNPRFEAFQKLRQQKGEATKSLLPLLDATSARLTLDIGDEVRLDGVLTYADASAAEKGLPAVKGIIGMARAGLAVARQNLSKDQEEVAKPFFNFLDAMLRTAKTEQQGADVRVAIESEKGSFEQLAGALLPAVQKVREAAMRVTSQNNLKQIALAMHNHNDQFGRLPAAAISSRAGKPLLSWRVAILPYIEEEALYRQFKLDEPWNSPHNIKLLEKMPKTYASPVTGISQPGHTFYRVFTGPNTPFVGATPPRIPTTFQDGTSNTILVVEAGQAVPWTKPDELVYNPAGPLPPLGGLFKNGFSVAMADGSVRFLMRTISEKTLRAAITPAGGEILGPDW